MTPNDAQIDVLLRRHAKQAKRDTATAHLDADELNAFAEGSLPPAARSRYVSHLSHCDDCRQVVTQLSISAGALANAEQSSPARTEGHSFLQKLAALFALPTMRYAAFAMVLLVVAGVAFLALRRPRESTMVAQNEPASQAPVSAVKPAGEATPATGTVENKQGNAERSAVPAQTDKDSNAETMRDQSIATDKPAPPPKHETETSADTPALAAKKAAELPVTNPSSPTYAPPPPGEGARFEAKSREQQNVGGIASVSGPRKSEPATDKFKMKDQPQAGEATKEERAGDDSRRAAVNQPPINGRRGVDEKSGGPKRNADNMAARNRNENEARTETAKTQSAGTENRASSEEAQTRSAGGRKFRRQGNAWVDQKFKSSMTLKSVSRGSDEFAALDAGLRSIAQQLGGEIIVVWKNKAYLIR